MEELLQLQENSNAEVNCLTGSSDDGMTMEKQLAGVLTCPRKWNGLTCWPQTVAGDVAVTSCPPWVAGVAYDVRGNATLDCGEDGFWANWSNYTQCQETGNGDLNEFEKLETQYDSMSLENVLVGIYYVGYSVSLCSIAFALLIFGTFKCLWCRRNFIHCNLLSTFALTAIFWMFNHSIIVNSNRQQQTLCKVAVTILNYSTVTNFFWMLAEGLYLYLVVVKVYAADLFSVRQYMAFSWGLPLVFVTIWASLKSNFDDNLCWLPSERYYYEYVVVAPILVALWVNVIFLINIVWVIVTKLEVSTGADGHVRELQQYRKGAKGFLVLMPLLGTTYILLLVQPGKRSPIHMPFRVLTATLVSIQGFCVTLFFCFRNGEVRAALRRRRWWSLLSRHCLLRQTPAGAAAASTTASAALRSQCDGDVHARNDEDIGSNIGSAIDGVSSNARDVSGKKRDFRSVEQTRGSFGNEPDTTQPDELQMDLHDFTAMAAILNNK